LGEGKGWTRREGDGQESRRRGTASERRRGTGLKEEERDTIWRWEGQTLGGGEV